MKRAFIPRTFAAHDGVFHADEVTAAALLLLCDLIDEDKIVRTRDESKIAECEYICDVGGHYNPEEKLFDHHQAEYQGEMSSAGMILEYLHDQGHFSESEYHHLKESLVKGVDDDDNGRVSGSLGFCSFSDVIANFAPIRRDGGDDEQDIAFHQALQFTLGHLKRARERLDYIHSCKALVAKSMEENKKWLLLEDNIPWQESFFELGGVEHPALFVVAPIGGQWKLRGVPPSPEDKMSVRQPLPEEWAGLMDEELKAVCGIEGAVFCHKGRFISVWENKEAALKALDIVLKE